MLGESVAHVILVDDEPMVLASLSALITFETPHTTVPFERAQQALDYLAAGGPASVIISDILMPEMDGVTFLSRARKLRPEVPRMILSGYADPSGLVTAMECAEPMVRMEKPWDNSAFLSNLRSAIKYNREHAA